MTLVAVLILFPTPSLHARGPDDALPGGRDASRAVAAFIHHPESGASPSDPSGIGEYADGEWGDDDGVGPLLDAPPSRARAGGAARSPADAGRP